MKRQLVLPQKGRALGAAISLSGVVAGRSAVHVASLTAAAMLALVLAGCSSPNPQAIDYQSTSRQAKKAPSLAVPPDLLAEQHAKLAAPADGDASLNHYQTSSGTPIVVDQVLPKQTGLHIERDGDQRWLVVSAIPADQLWGQIRAFWQQQGFVLTEDSRERGVMQTDWRESHATLDQGLIRNTLSMAVNNSYITGERNRFRTRLEKGPNGSVYVFVSQQGLHEVLTGSSNDGSSWVSRPNDPGLEADYLGRLQQALASGPQRPAYGPDAQPLPAPAPTSALPSSMGAAQVAAQPMLPQGVIPAGDGLLLSEDYDRAWQRVGRALDRGNFTVDGRDRENGMYSLRYVDPNDLGTAAQGFWNQIFHGKKEKVAHQYQVNVKAITMDSTRVTLLDAKGQPDTTPLGQRIMRLVVANL